jgi:hypothetical protein
MTNTFGNENHVIVYSLEKIIFFCRSHQDLFAAQCVWWLAAIIGFQEGLVIHINNLQIRCGLATKGYEADLDPSVSQLRNGSCKRQDMILKNCEEFFPESKSGWKTFEVDPLQPNLKSKVFPAPLTKKQRNQLQAIPSNALRQCSGGIISPNDQFYISWTIYSRLSLCPSLLIFPDSTSYCVRNQSIPLFLIHRMLLFRQLFVRQRSSINVPVHLVSNPFQNSRVPKYLGDVC